MLRIRLSALVFSFLVVCCTTSQGQQQEKTTPPEADVICQLRPTCPIISIDRADEKSGTGSLVTFNGNVVSGDPTLQLTGKWTVSAGTIISGQDTWVITVDASGLAGQTITVTLEIVGLNPACAKTASTTTTLAPFICGLPFDTFGIINLEDEQARLDNFANELASAPSEVGYITTYGGRRGLVGEAQRRAERAKQYLIKRRQIAAAQIVTMDGGYREEATTVLVIVPPGATPPTASPTVSPDEVQIIHSNKQRRRPK